MSFHFNNRYARILKHSDINKSNVANKEWSEKKNYPTVISSTSYCVAPVLFDYVFWILQESQQKGIKRLYFLARDGFILYEISKLIVQKYGLDVDCRYLYTSRFASRVPCYHIIGKSCLDFICEKKLFNSLKTVLQNITLDSDEQQSLASLLGKDLSSACNSMDSNALENLKEECLQNSSFMESIYEKSKDSYEVTINYFRQEGLFDTVPAAFVDVGWRGTIQVFLNKLINKSLPGFYFGLYTTDFLDNANNEYYTYLFSSKTESNFVKFIFNNSLFECFCSAPHGMTIGYENSDNEIVPVFSSKENFNSKRWILDEQIKLILSYTENFLKVSTAYAVDKETTIKLLKKLMNSPTKTEARIYGKYLFSDETNEKNLIPLAPPFTTREIIYSSFIPNKVVHEIFQILGIKAKTPVAYWRQGSLKNSKTLCFFKWWYSFYHFYHTKKHLSNFEKQHTENCK